MIAGEVTAVIYGIAAAVVWGAGDFSGGVAAKRTSAFAVVIVSQSVGLAILAAAVWLFHEPLPAAADLMWAAAAGLSSSGGLVMLYRALSRGSMGVVAPVTAVVTVSAPLAIGILWEGLPAPVKIAGFGLALASIVLVTRASNRAPFRPADLRLPVLAGLCFGLFFILLDHVANRAVLWPVVAVRLVSIPFIALLARLSGRPLVPAARRLPLLALVGLCETGGTLLFVMAARAGRLDIAAVLASLYPAVTALLARAVLNERLRRIQWLGIAAALAAVALISS